MTTRRLAFAALASALFAASTVCARAETIRLELESVSAGVDQRTNEPVVSGVLTPASQRAFGRFTSARVGLTVDLRVGGKVMSSPRILEPILGGQIQVSGLAGIAEAEAMVEAIRAGRAKVEVVDAKR